MKKYIMILLCIVWVVFWLQISGCQPGYNPSTGGSLGADLHEDMAAIYGEEYGKVNEQGQYETLEFDVEFRKLYRFKKGTSISKIADRLGTDSPEMVAAALDMDLSTGVSAGELTIPARYVIDLFQVHAVYTIWPGPEEQAAENPDDFICRKTITHLAMDVQNTSHRGTLISGGSITYDPDKPEKNSFME